MPAKDKESGVTTVNVAAVTGGPAAPAAADAVPDECKADVERLAKLRREVQDLADKLAEAGVVAAYKPPSPRFGMSEGTRDELERTGKATDPFTGAKLTRDDLKRRYG